MTIIYKQYKREPRPTRSERIKLGSNYGIATRATATQTAAEAAANHNLSTTALLAEGCGARFGGRGKVAEGDGAIAAWCGGEGGLTATGGVGGSAAWRGGEGGLTAAGDGDDKVGGVDTGDEVGLGEGE